MISRANKPSSFDLKDSIGKEGIEYLTTVLRAKRDPVWFVRNILGVDLFPKQEWAIREFYRNKYDSTLLPYKEGIFAWGQRSGKTAVMGGFTGFEMFDICTVDNPASHYGLIKNQPIFIPVLAPSIDQAIDGVFANTANYIEGSEFLQSWMDWKILGEEIYSPSKNVTVKCFGSWATTARGRTSKCVVIDEADMFEDTTSKRGGAEVYTAMKNSTETFGNDGHMLIISSTKSPNGTILTLYNEAEYKQNVLRSLLPTWEVNPHQSKEKLMKEHEFRLPEFWRDFGCNPSMWNPLEFPNGVKLETRTNVLQNDFDFSTLGINKTVIYPHVFAIDPAVKNDSFGIACGYYDPNLCKIIVDGATRYRRQDGDVIIKPSMVRDFLRSKMPKLNTVLLVHDTWMYPDILEMVIYELGIATEQNIVKKEHYDLLKSLMGKEECSVVYDRELKIELEALEVTKAAKPNVNHPATGSKDTADCVANVVWYLYQNQAALMNTGIVAGRSF